MLALPLLITTATCNKNSNTVNDCECDKTLNNVIIDNLEGTIRYDKETKTWNIYYNTLNTYDKIKVFIPCSMEDKYKKEGLEVRFSGNSFPSKKKIISPAGITYLCIDNLSIFLN